MTEYKTITQLARELRRKQTPEEAALWHELRNRQLKGCKFLRQHPIVYGYSMGKPLFFIADFYCAAQKLVLELDGEVHEFQKDYDQNRDQILNKLGLRVLRFENRELKNIENVKERIAASF